MEGRKRKTQANMDKAPSGRRVAPNRLPPDAAPQAKVNWGQVGDVAGTAGATFSAFGDALGDTAGDAAAAAPAADNTMMILGGVLLLGVIVFAMSKK